MACLPFCAQPEWIARAGRELLSQDPAIGLGTAAYVAVKDLWPEACDLPPEVAARTYLAAREQPRPAS